MVLTHAEKKMLAIGVIEKVIENNKGKDVNYFSLLDIIEKNYGFGNTFLKGQLFKYHGLGKCKFNQEDNIIEVF